MSFYGKKYRRVGHENIEELLAATKNNGHLAAIITSKPPTVCFTKRHDDVINIRVELDDRTYLNRCVLGLEKEIPMPDGGFMKITFTEYSENILDQDVTMPNGKRALFRRVFGDSDCKLIISMPDTSITATIYFEVIE